uniref:Uncharacterized protein n=1 Tax=Thermorudis peleae TaxID=1382356 RepID=A0A831X6D4_9BACT
MGVGSGVGDGVGVGVGIAVGVGASWGTPGLPAESPLAVGGAGRPGSTRHPARIRMRIAMIWCHRLTRWSSPLSPAPWNATLQG